MATPQYSNARAPIERSYHATVETASNFADVGKRLFSMSMDPVGQSLRFFAEAQRAALETLARFGALGANPFLSAFGGSNGQVRSMTGSERVMPAIGATVEDAVGGAATRTAKAAVSQRPTATKPATTKAKPAATKQPTSKPAATKPAATKRPTNKPAATKPAAPKRPTSKSAATKPAATKTKSAATKTKPAATKRPAATTRPATKRAPPPRRP